MFIDEVRTLAMERGKNPRVHPNGFIQLDVGEVEENWDKSKKRGHSGAATRVHIWNPPDVELPHQGTVNEVHDHVFDMESTVVRGVLHQRLFHFIVGKHKRDQCTHELYRAVYDKQSSSRLEPMGVPGVLQEHQIFPIKECGSYNQPAFTLHDSVAVGCTITLMQKRKIHDGDATVVCPIGQSPDNSFDRATAMGEEELWDAIRKAFA